jgi:hypothetical protein
MKFLTALFIGWLAAVPPVLNAQSRSSSGPVDSQVIELEAFVVYEGLIDVVDGFTGDTTDNSPAERIHH